jgi:hypothetical protein
LDRTARLSKGFGRFGRSIEEYGLAQGIIELATLGACLVEELLTAAKRRLPFFDR